jgi:hypothetical protein
MRTEFINQFAELNAAELESLTSEIKETVVSDLHSKNSKPAFTAANLWNIHNMKRNRAPRKNYFS